MTEPTEDAARIAALEADNKRLQHEAEASDAAFQQCERDYQRVQRELIHLRAERPRPTTSGYVLIAIIALALAVVLQSYRGDDLSKRITALEERSK